VKLIVPKRFADVRGYFSETWSDRLFRREVANVAFVQDNQSGSGKKETLRGLHFQKPPFVQGKLVRVVRGSILDIAVDIRSRSRPMRSMSRLSWIRPQERRCGYHPVSSLVFALSKT
jgi:dTDP-4-dehydrorhamnose 3,5-epimerase